MGFGKKMYDQTNDKVVETTVIPGETKDPNEGRPIVPKTSFHGPAADAYTHFDNRQTDRVIPEDQTSIYDEGVPVEGNLNDYRADNQPWYHKFATSLVGGAISGLGTYVQDMSYMLDVANTADRVFGDGHIESNAFADAAQWVKDWADQALPSYERNVKESDGLTANFFRWSTFRSAIDSAVGYGLAGGTVGRATAKIGKTILRKNVGLKILLDQNKGLNAIAKGTSGAQNANQMLSNLAPALIQNFGQGKVMGLEIYENMMEEFRPFIDQGTMTESEAIEKASNAADRFQMYNFLFVAVDYAGFKNIYNAKVLTDLTKKFRPTLGKTIKQIGKQSGKEYGEEVGQKLGQDEAMYQGFREAEKEFGIYNASSPMVKYAANGTDVDLFNEHMSDYYNSKEGQDYANKIRGNAIEVGGQAEYERLLKDHFVEVANGNRFMANKSNRLFERTFNNLVSVPTQVEGFMGMFSSAGQWAITRGFTYKSQLKQQQEEFDKKAKEFNASKSIFQNNVMELKSFKELHAELQKQDNENTSDKDNVAFNDEDDMPSQAVKEEVAGTEKKTQSEVLEDNTWLQMALNSIAQGTDAQLQSVIEEQIANSEGVAKEQAQKLLNEFEGLREFGAKDKNYYNSYEVTKARLELKNQKESLKAVENDQTVSNKVKDIALDNINKQKEHIKELTSFATQKELLIKANKQQDLQSYLNKALRKQDVLTLNRIVFDETMPLEMRADASEALSKMDDATLNKRPWYSRRENKQYKKDLNKAKEEKVEKEKEVLKKKRDTANIRKSKDLEKLDRDIEAATTRIGDADKKTGVAGMLAKDSENEDLKKSLKNEQDNLKTLENKRKAIIEVTSELADETDAEFDKKFDKALSDKLKSIETPNRTSVFTPEMGKVIKEKASKQNIRVEQFKSNNNNKTLDKVMGDAVSADAIVEGNHPSMVGKVTRITDSDGNIKYKIKTEDGYETIIDSKTVGSGVLTISNDSFGNFVEGQVLYKFKTADGGTISIGNVEFTDQIGKSIYELMTEETANPGPGEQDGGSNTTVYDVSNADQIILEKGLKDRRSIYPYFTLEYAKALFRNKDSEFFKSRTEYSKAIDDLMDTYNKLLSDVGLIYSFDRNASKEDQRYYMNIVRGLASDPIAAVTIQNEAKALGASGENLVKADTLLAIDNYVAKRDGITEETKTPKTAKKNAGLTITDKLNRLIKAIDVQLASYGSLVQRKAKKKRIVNLFDSIIRYREGEVTTLSELVQLINDLASKDKYLTYISNNFELFTELASEVASEMNGISIAIDVTSYNQALGLEATTTNEQLGDTNVTRDPISELERETEGEMDGVNDQDKIVRKEFGVNGIIIYLNSKLQDAFNKIAYLSKKYIKDYVKLSPNHIEVSYKDLSDNIMWTDSISRSIAEKDEITLSVDKGYTGPIKFGDVTMSYTEFLEQNSADQKTLDENTVIVIKKGDKVLGHLHNPTWVSSKKIDGDVDINKDKIRAIRALVNKQGSVTTTISKKGAGIIFKLTDPITTSKAVGEDVTLYVAARHDSNNWLMRGGVSKDGTTRHKKISSKTYKKPGITYMKIPLTSTINMIVPLKNKPINAQQRLTIETAMDIFNNKDKKHKLWKAVKDQTRVDITTEKGIKNFLKKYIRLYNFPEGLTNREKEVIFKTAEEEALMIGAPLFGIITIGNKKQIVGKRQFSSNMTILNQVDAKLLGTPNFIALEINEEGDVVDVNDGRNFDEFVKDNTETQYGGHKHTNEDGSVEWVYSYQNVIEFDTKFADEENNEGEGSNEGTGEGAQGGSSFKEDEAGETDMLKDQIIEALLKNKEITYTEEDGKPCKRAANGARSRTITPGSKWSLAKDLKGHPSHAKGGVDISIGKGGVSFKSGGATITAAAGLMVPALSQDTDPEGGGEDVKETNPTTEEATEQK